MKSYGAGFWLQKPAAVTAIFMPKTSWTWKLEKNAREKSSRRAPRLSAQHVKMRREMRLQVLLGYIHINTTRGASLTGGDLNFKSSHPHFRVWRKAKGKKREVRRMRFLKLLLLLLGAAER
jgi:hypothetical protein